MPTHPPKKKEKKKQHTYFATEWNQRRTCQEKEQVDRRALSIYTYMKVQVDI